MQQEWKEAMVPQKVILYGGSFNPPARHHRRIALRLTHLAELVMIIPCGLRTDKASVSETSLVHREAMAKLNFARLARVKFDFDDLDDDIFTPTWELQEKYAKIFPSAEIWHAVGGDIVCGGKTQSEMCQTWQRGPEIWEKLNFIVVHRPGYRIKKVDLPPHAQQTAIKHLCGTGTMVRERIRQGLPVERLLLPEVWKYIQHHQIYR